MAEFIQVVYGFGTLVLIGLFVHGLSPLRRYLRTRRRPVVVGAAIAAAWLVLPAIVPLPSEPSPTPAAQSRPTDTTDSAPSTATTTEPSSTHHARSAKTSSAVVHTPPTSKNKPRRAARTNGYLVTRVVDGDTVHVARGGRDETVRLLGIDTPETKDPRKGVGCYGPQASAWATRTLLGRHVGVATDPTQDRRDKYGRLLAYLRLPDGADYSIEAAELGYAKYYLYDVPVSKASKIQRAERSARAAGRGLWGPTCHGHTDAARKAGAISADPTPKPLFTNAPAGSGPSYANCAAVRAAGAAPLHRGQPGYTRRLDRDGDGLACE